MLSQPETGALTVARMLKRAGVRVIFSLSGNQIMPLYDACFEEELRIVHVRHEGAAVYMADAYAQITGELGVALLTAGPGFANGVGALMTARAAESPVLLLSGDSPRAQDGSGAFQELDQCAVARPLVKQSHRAAGPDGLGQEVAGMIATARGGRPGPVHLALPFDSLTACASHGGSAEVPARAFTPAAQPLAADAAREVADLIAGAERPLIVTGPQLSRSRTGDLPERLESATGAPVICMESPRGLRDPALGALGAVASRADLVVLLGKAADFTTAFLAVEPWDVSARFVVIDPEAAMLTRARARLNGRLSADAQADSPAAAEALIATARPRDGAGWRKETGALLAERSLDAATAQVERINPIALCGKVQARLEAEPDAILCIDGGEFGQWAQAFCTARWRVINGVAGGIGGTLPAAIAARIACPDAPVYAMMGDGTAGFHLSELETAAREAAGITVVIGNDDRWNAEHQIQRAQYGPDRLIGCGLSVCARYDAVASAFGGFGARVEEESALGGALTEAAAAAAQGRPACVNVAIAGLAAPVFTARGEDAAAPVH